jgi:predicted metal-dependent hydrolase
MTDDTKGQGGIDRGRATDEPDGVFVCTDGHEEPWRVRRSAKARRIHMSVSPREGLVVVLPQHSHLDPATCLEEARPQIERMIERVRPAREDYLARLKAPLPVKLDLPGIAETWGVDYRRSSAEHVTARARTDEKSCDEADRLILGTGDVLGHMPTGLLRLSGDMDDRPACEKALRAFVVRRAKAALPVVLDALSHDFGIPVRGCRVRMTKTRWGSCSSDGRIMLSAALVFLPAQLVMHVICHELVHIEYPNHSPAFRARLGQLDPLSDDHNRILREASSCVPPWMFN